jgi:hypothetical protein
MEGKISAEIVADPMDGRTRAPQGGLLARCVVGRTIGGVAADQEGEEVNVTGISHNSKGVGEWYRTLGIPNLHINRQALSLGRRTGTDDEPDTPQGIYKATTAAG